MGKATDGKRMAVFGKSGMGKSQFVRSMIGSADRVVAFDPGGDYADLPGFQTVSTIAALAEALDDCKFGSFKLAFAPTPMREQVQLSSVCLLVEAMQHRLGACARGLSALIVADELNNAFPVTPDPSYPGFARACSMGRKLGISVIGVSQRPAEVGTRFRGNLDRLVAFKFSGPHDVKAVMAVTGGEGEAEIRTLSPYHYLDWGDGGVKICPPVPL